jgi:rubrerythrin
VIKVTAVMSCSEDIYNMGPRNSVYRPPGSAAKETAMKVTLYSIGIVAMAALLAIAGIGAERGPALRKQTQDNLSTAMHGEAFAYAKYMLYAQHARMNGNKELAALFMQSASTERFQHFAEEADLAGVVGTDKDNLRDAIAGESYEVDTMYREFAEQATAAGDKAAADRFEEIRRDEMGHRDAFRAALAKPEVKSVGSK